MAYEMTKILLGGDNPLLIIAQNEAQQKLKDFHASLGEDDGMPHMLKFALFMASAAADDDIIVIPLEFFGAQLQVAESARDEFSQYREAEAHARRKFYERKAQMDEEDDDADDLSGMVPQGNA